MERYGTSGDDDKGATPGSASDGPGPILTLGMGGAGPGISLSGMGLGGGSQPSVIAVDDELE